MLFKNYHLSSMKWSYKDIINIDLFLEDFKHELTSENIEENLCHLYRYRNELISESKRLYFGNCSLEFKGLDEAVAIIRGLEIYKLN